MGESEKTRRGTKIIDRGCRNLQGFRHNQAKSAVRYGRNTFTVPSQIARATPAPLGRGMIAGNWYDGLHQVTRHQFFA